MLFELRDSSDAYSFAVSVYHLAIPVIKTSSYGGFTFLAVSELGSYHFASFSPDFLAARYSTIMY